MPIKFNPIFSLSVKVANCLLRIEAAKEKVLHLPLSPLVVASLRETARLYTTHYSTMIEGNRLEPEQIEKVLKEDVHISGRQREEKEVKGYYAALKQVEEWAKEGSPLTETRLKTLHALVMAGGRSKVKPTPYRDGQNVIRDSRTQEIVYMPPEAKDVPDLIQGMLEWLSGQHELPRPLVAGIVHYQFATIHPYYDGNGRCARLLTTFILHLGGYDLKGLYSLEEYYAQNLLGYYDALTVGPSHNYYRGRAEANITPWIEYFIEGMARSFESVLERMKIAETSGEKAQAELLRKLDPKQRKILELFYTTEIVTASQIGKLLGFKARTSSLQCKNWVEAGFLEIVDYAKKTRRYRLAHKYQSLLNHG